MNDCSVCYDQSQREEAVRVTRALMEMKHLGSTLRATVYAPSPQVLGLTESVCVCVCVCVHTVYMYI